MGLRQALKTLFGSSAAPGWNGDFQTGNFSQYQGVQQTSSMGKASVGSHTSYVIATPAGAPLKYVAQAKVYADSTGNHANKSRAETLASAAATANTPGTTQTYEWYSLFPKSGHQNPNGWRIYTQFSTGSGYDTPSFQEVLIGGQPHLQLAIDSGTLAAPKNAAHYDLGAIQFDHWYHFLLTVAWSRSSNGHVTLVQDGKTVVDVAHQTLPSDKGQGALKQGVYQHDGANGEHWVTGTRRW